MRRRRMGMLVVGSLVWLGAACGGEDQGPSDTPLVIEKPATKSGDLQIGPTETALGNPLRVLITRDGEPVEGVEVNWSANLGGVITDELESDDTGIATATWTLGPAEGDQVATATVDGATNSPLSYTATAENDDQPAGVTVQVLPNNTFSPATVNVSPGGSVTWVWEEGSGLHNVFPDAQEPTSSGPLAAGPKTYTYTFDAPGTYRYYCIAHGNRGGIGMSGLVVVQAR